MKTRRSVLSEAIGSHPTQETGVQVSQYLQSSDEGEGLLYVHRNPTFIRDGLQSSEQAGIYNIYYIFVCCLSLLQLAELLYVHRNHRGLIRNGRPASQS